MLITFSDSFSFPRSTSLGAKIKNVGGNHCIFTLWILGFANCAFGLHFAPRNISLHSFWNNRIIE